jgi:TetR/AcrR family transcriptional regulator
MTKLIHPPLKGPEETILMIAEEVFAQYSFAGATVRMIANKSRVNSSMISYYFGSKEALYINIFDLRLGEITEEISWFEKLDLDPAQKLVAYLTAYIDRVISNRNFHRLLGNELVCEQHSSVTLIIFETRKRIHDFLLEIIGSGIAKGYFKKIDEEVLVLNILALVWSVFIDHVTTRIHLQRSPDENLTRRITDYIMTMVTITEQNKSKTKSHV